MASTPSNFDQTTSRTYARIVPHAKNGYWPRGTLTFTQKRYGDKQDELMKWEDQWHQKSTPDDMKTRM